jgi:hypothetical protein
MDELTVVFACLFWVGEGLSATAVHAFGSHVAVVIGIPSVCDSDLGLFGRNAMAGQNCQTETLRQPWAVCTGRKSCLLGVSRCQGQE